MGVNILQGRRGGGSLVNIRHTLGVETVDMVIAILL